MRTVLGARGTSIKSSGVPHGLYARFISAPVHVVQLFLLDIGEDIISPAAGLLGAEAAIGIAGPSPTPSAVG